MKVVLFCGGMGTRIRDEGINVPKPLVTIGYRPIIWHLMMYYAHYGHKDFILCLGYKADEIKKYFLNYNEALSNDFVLNGRGGKVDLLNRDIDDWKITFVDTGLNSNIGQRLVAVKEHLQGEDYFMANYADGLTDAPLDKVVDNFMKRDKIGSILSVTPSQSFHVVSLTDKNDVESVRPITDSGHYMNGGFFVFKKELFNYINEGEELVYEPFERLIAEKQLTAYQHDKFWACMDTFKERQYLEELYSQGKAPWVVWQKHS